MDYAYLPIWAVSVSLFFMFIQGGEGWSNAGKRVVVCLSFIIANNYSAAVLLRVLRMHAIDSPYFSLFFTMPSSVVLAYVVYTLRRGRIDLI